MYFTMNDMKYCLQVGKLNFLKELGDKTMEYSEFLDKLNEARKKLDAFNHSKLSKLRTTKHEKLESKLGTYLSVNALIKSTSSQGLPLNKESVEHMYNTHNPEETLKCFDPMGYEIYMSNKDKVQNLPDSMKDEKPNYNLDEDEKQPNYDDDNIELE